MPDLATHTALSYIIFSFTKRRASLGVIFLVGNVIPDVLTRAVGFFLPQRFQWFLAPFHTPAGFLTFAFLLSFFFAEEIRKEVFLFLSLGGFFHSFLDMFNYNFQINYFWFFPFSWRTFQIGWFFPEDSLYILPFLLVLVFIKRKK